VLGDRVNLGVLAAARKREGSLHLISATTKQAKEPVEVDEEMVMRLAKGILRERTVNEKIELMVRWFASRSIEIGQELVFAPETDYPAAWCRSAKEWRTLFAEIVNGLGYLSLSSGRVSVSIAGWKWLAELPKAKGQVGFIAMPFSGEHKSLYEAIYRGIENAGYEPVRVDEDHYTGGVMERVLARIRESRFVVAEFADNRGGVYYEAGFALGLGIPTIHLCSQAQLDSNSEEERLHFDVSHLGFLPWEADKLGVLTERLRTRIMALFGRGPLAK
jgi:hypothetical protein